MTSTLSASGDRPDEPGTTGSGVEQADQDTESHATERERAEREETEREETEAEREKAAKRAEVERIGRMVAVFIFPFLLVSMMISGYLAAMHHTEPRDMPIAVTGPTAEAVRFAETLETADPDAVDVRVVDTDADAQRLVLDREVSGAVALP
ncbi:MAG TPA: hypothetical protein VK083_02830 [Nocardia sp.]|nr:hypothetical protein [Nocardia sp.]HLS75712.1 hypothetical protein [Nocardia sp.]